ncbi:PKD domain-containing protein [Occultella glacieicola]|uniref:PKD domain-containing protein n=2 Tax=Occultella glacieicola TaxID=2518684 RepID=A0ABY2E7F7_9MICO|nr:PKD domain-containing protein [Occultella glacieicola]
MAGTLTDVDVTLHGVTHGILNDMDVLLVAPGGSNLVIMSDIGGSAALASASNAELTLSDGGAPFPASGQVGSGTYAPTDVDVGETVADTFAPGGGPAPSTNATFADAFGGLDPNGTWSLYVIDDTDGDTGTIAGGWSLTLTTAEATQPGLLAFGAAEYRGTEGDGTIDITVQRTAGADGAVSARFTTANGTAVDGVDYTAVSQVVPFADGQTSAVVSIPVLDDPDPGADVDLTVTLDLPTGGAALGGRTTARVVIENDDGSANPTGIVIPSSGAAAPYPSNVRLSGLGSYVTDVEVTLAGITHSSPADIDVVLVGPAGQTVVLFSDVGNIQPISDVTLTFDDDAATTVPVPPVSGTFRPTDVDLDGDGSPLPDAPMPAPAPAGPYGTSLAVFNGSDPNGTWRLFVVDDATGDAGSIDGWSLAVTTATVDAGGPYAIAEGDPLFSLAATSDLAGATYAWDMDGDGTFDDGNGSSPDFGAGILALYGLGDGPTTATVSVQATDGTVTLTDSATLTVSNLPPTGTIGNSGPIPIGSSVTVTLSDLADPSAADVAAGLGYALDWDGDGTADASGSWTAGDPDPTISVPAVALGSVGDHVLVVTLSDKDGGAADLSTTVVVEATTPTATLTNSGPVAEGGTATVTFTDPVDAAPGATFTYSFDFDDDGTFEVVDATDPSAAVPGALTVDGPAPVTVTGRIANQYGGSSDHTTEVLVTNAAPSGTLTNDGPVLIGEPVTLALSDLADPSAADVAAGLGYALDWDGDGTADASGSWTAGDPDPTISVPAVALGSVGDHVLVVTLSDKDGGAADLSTTVVVEATTPTATLTNSGPVAEGDTATVTFTDPVDAAPGATFTYSFDLDNDGTFDIVDATDPTAPVGTPDGPATVMVSARIANQYGGSSDYTTDVLVENLAPSGMLANDGPVVIGVPAVLTLTDLDDASPTDLAAGLDYVLDWDGDDIADASGSWTTGDPEPTISVPPAVLTSVGDHVLVVTLSDKDGGATDLSTTVVVEASTPTATLTNSGPVAEGDTATVTFTDPVDAAPGATFTYSFDIDGDGTFDVVDSADPTAEVPAALTADGPATVTVAGRITNQYGGSSDHTTDVEVTSEGPMLTVSAPGTVEVAEELTVSVTLDDASPSDRAAGFELTVDFGVRPDSGTGPGSRALVPTPTVTLTVAAGTTELSHIYTSPGTYALTVTAVDADGAATTVTQEVTVEPAAATPPGPGGGGGSGGGGSSGLPDTGAAPAALGLAALLAIGLGVGLYRRSRV